MGGLKKFFVGNHYYGLLPCSLGEEVPLPFSILQASWGPEGGEQAGWRSLDVGDWRIAGVSGKCFGSSSTAREHCQFIRL